MLLGWTPPPFRQDYLQNWKPSRKLGVGQSEDYDGRVMTNKRPVFRSREPIRGRALITWHGRVWAGAAWVEHCLASADTGDTDHDVITITTGARSRPGAGGGGQVRGGSRAWPHLLHSAQTELAETRKWAISGHGEWQLNTRPYSAQTLNENENENNLPSPRIETCTLSPKFPAAVLQCDPKL